MNYYNIEILFDERKRVGANLFEIIKEKGYTKISFSKAAGISRPTLNHLFEGEINSVTTFEKHIEKVRAVLGIGEQELMVERCGEQPILTAAFSCNELEKCIPNRNEREMFEILKGLLNLCDFYY
ncbi:helix-turn-helix transcriptional regulator [Roseburia hominis]